LVAAEIARAIAQQDRNVVIVVVGHGDVLPAIAIEIPTAAV
jgi:hypothetical protein